ncbi:MAG: DMT family transporter [Acidobacteria bacterium]|nr:DMT family transporter [Acidobacteriota bacterium]
MTNQYPTVSHHNSRIIPGLIIGAVLISFSGVWVRLSHVTPESAAFYRVLIGGVFLLLGSIWRREFCRLSRLQTGLMFLAGVLFALDLICFHTSILYVGPGLGTILPNFQVFIMALVGILFFKERLRPLYLLSVLLAVAGLFLVVGIRWDLLGAQYRLGIYAGLATSVFYSGFLLSVRKLHTVERTSKGETGKLSFFYILMLVSLTTAGVLAVEMLLSGDSFAIPDTQSLLSLTVLGVFSQGVGWILIAHALPRLRVSISGLILLLQPALAFLWDVSFFDRPTGGLNWAGVIVVLVAIYMGTVGAKSAQATD